MKAFPLPRRSTPRSSCLTRRLQHPRPGLQARPRISLQLIHNSSPLQDDVPTSASASTSQAQPLGDYYADLLSTPIPTPALRTLPTFVPASGDLTKEERAARLFGTVKGSGYEHHTAPSATWQTVNGVPVPPRPTEPDNCCMSGCVHCVWDDYRDDIEGWAARLREAHARGSSGHTARGSGVSPKVGLHREEVQVASGSMDDDGGGSEGLWDTPSVPPTASGGQAKAEDLFQGIPIGIREFMATEKRIRERKNARRRQS